MHEPVGVIARSELSVRAGRPVLFAGVPLALIAGLLEVFTPVFINGDPLTLGPVGLATGAFTGTVTGLFIATAVLFGLLGADLDRGILTERLRHGAHPGTVAVGQGIAAFAAGLSTWAATAACTAIAGTADLTFRAVIGARAEPSHPAAFVITTGAAGPAIIAAATALLWLLIIATRSGTRAAILLAGLTLSFALALTSSTGTSASLLLLHPIAGPWRALSALPVGTELPGALHDNPTRYLVSTMAWILLLAWAARRGLTRLATDDSHHRT